MNNQIRFIWQILVISCIVLLAGIAILVVSHIDLPVLHFAMSLFATTLITIISHVIMAKGIEKSDREGTFYLIAGLGLKFVLYLLFILVFWLITKNLSKPFIIAFFLLYLTFTFLMVRSLFKLLKVK